MKGEIYFIAFLKIHQTNFTCLSIFLVIIRNLTDLIKHKIQHQNLPSSATSQVHHFTINK